tara:strand:- start:2694 stop:3713 length:1020 start_codon:yes stop_codon:yes gene_type:complete
MALRNENMIANGEIPVEQPTEQPAGLSMEQLDHEFLGRGDPQVDALRLRERYEQNLTPEELARVEELAPAVEEFFLLDFKGRTGEFPEGERQMSEDPMSSGEEISIEEYGNIINADNKEEVLSKLLGNRERIVPQRSEIPSRQTEGGSPPPAPAPQPVAPVAESASEPRIPVATGGLPSREDIGQSESVLSGNATPTLEEAGESGMIQEPGKSDTGVADDIPMDVQEGDFILNAAAVTHAGITDVYKMIENAKAEYRELVARGVIKPVQGQSVEKVPIKISNGEVRISKQLADIIGMDKLEKMNNRGLEKTQEELQEQEQLAQSNPTPEQVQSPKGRMT